MTVERYKVPMVDGRTGDDYLAPWSGLAYGVDNPLEAPGTRPNAAATCMWRGSAYISVCSPPSNSEDAAKWNSPVS